MPPLGSEAIPLSLFKLLRWTSSTRTTKCVAGQFALDSTVVPASMLIPD